MLQNSKWKNYIITDPKVLVGKPVIKGTRISVEYLLGLFSQGWTEKQILEEYPSITKASLQAFFSYLKEYFKDEFHFSITEKNKRNEKPLRKTVGNKTTKRH